MSKDPVAPKQQKRARKVRRSLLAAACILVLAVTVSVGGYVSRSQESLTATLATWARDHGLGVVVDELEQLRYGSPPSATPASELGTVEAESSISPQHPTVVFVKNTRRGVTSLRGAKSGRWILKPQRLL